MRGRQLTLDNQRILVTARAALPPAALDAAAPPSHAIEAAE